MTSYFFLCMTSYSEIYSYSIKTVGSNLWLAFIPKDHWCVWAYIKYYISITLFLSIIYYRIMQYYVNVSGIFIHDAIFKMLCKHIYYILGMIFHIYIYSSIILINADLYTWAGFSSLQLHISRKYSTSNKLNNRLAISNKDSRSMIVQQIQLGIILWFDKIFFSQITYYWKIAFVTENQISDQFRFKKYNSILSFNLIRFFFSFSKYLC